MKNVNVTLVQTMWEHIRDLEERRSIEDHFDSKSPDEVAKAILGMYALDHRIALVWSEDGAANCDTFSFDDADEKAADELLNYLIVEAHIDPTDEEAIFNAVMELISRYHQGDPELDRFGDGVYSAAVRVAQRLRPGLFGFVNCSDEELGRQGYTLLTVKKRIPYDKAA